MDIAEYNAAYAVSQRIDPIAGAKGIFDFGLGAELSEHRFQDRGWHLRLARGGAVDAILVSAKGPDVPDGLKAQRAIGGRLVMPIGQPLGLRLGRVRRIDETTYEQNDLGAVSFVLLVGRQG